MFKICLVLFSCLVWLKVIELQWLFFATTTKSDLTTTKTDLTTTKADLNYYKIRPERISYQHIN